MPPVPPVPVPDLIRPPVLASPPGPAYGPYVAPTAPGPRGAYAVRACGHGGPTAPGKPHKQGKTRTATIDHITIILCKVMYREPI